MSSAATTPAPAFPPDAARTIFVRGVLCGVAAGAVFGVALTLALTRPVEGMMKLVRSRVLGGELREPQFELLN